MFAEAWEEKLDPLCQSCSRHYRIDTNAPKAECKLNAARCNQVTPGGGGQNCLESLAEVYHHLVNALGFNRPDQVRKLVALLYQARPQWKLSSEASFDKSCDYDGFANLGVEMLDG